MTRVASRSRLSSATLHWLEARCLPGRGKTKGTLNRMKIQRTLLGVIAAALITCAPVHYSRYQPAALPTEKPIGRVFLIGDAGQVAFEEVEDEAQPEKAEERVEKKQRTLWRPRAAPVPAGSAAKLFKDIVEETIALATKSAKESPILKTLTGDAKSRATLAPGVTPTIVWLGDNVYETGVPKYPGEEGYRDGTLTPLGEEYIQAAAIIVMQAQISVEAKADGLFVPGNHDWQRAWIRGPGGRVRVIEQGKIIARFVAQLKREGKLGDLEIRILPSGGCPGPETFSITLADKGQVELVALDTDWLLDDNPDEGCAPGECGPCPSATREQVYASLAAKLSQAGPRDTVIVAAHHPLLTYGPHGGRIFSDPKTWLRWLPLSVQDMAHPMNRRMRKGIESAFLPEKDQPLIFAAGHEHNLQVLRKDEKGPFLLISGAASRLSPLRAGSKGLLGARKNGYMIVDFFRHGRVLLYVVEIDPDGTVFRNPPLELRAARS